MKKIKTLLVTLIVIVAIDLGVSLYNIKRGLDIKSRVDMVEGVQDSILGSLL